MAIIYFLDYRINKKHLMPTVLCKNGCEMFAGSEKQYCNSYKPITINRSFLIDWIICYLERINDIFVLSLCENFWVINLFLAIELIYFCRKKFFPTDTKPNI